MTYLRPLQIRDLVLENNLLQAPLAGYSSAPFRALVWRLGRPGLLASEMISANAIYQGARTQDPYLARAEEEGPVAFQLWGRMPEALECAARVAQERGADVIDINCGCPVPKVRAAGAGSKLMEEPELVGRLVQAMRRGSDRPVTVKIRVGTGSDHYNGVEVAKAAEEAGADLITVHGRHAQERYGHPVRYEKIAEIVASSKVPVVGNGDVRDGASAIRMFAETGCAGVMVGRACMGDPWVFARIKAEMAGGEWTAPSPQELGLTLLEHYDLLVDLVGNDRAIRQSRKLGAFYSRGLQGAKDFRSSLNNVNSREELAKMIDQLTGKSPARRTFDLCDQLSPNLL